jgi:YD repeat-containing protein
LLRFEANSRDFPPTPNIYDAWGRLVEIENQSSATVAAFEYNGLGHRIGHQWNKDADTDLDQQWLAYDDKWRVVARFEDGADVDELFEQVYHHHAGLAGYGGSSYIDLVIARFRDADTDWASGPETREYVLQNWRADVVALVAPDGDLLERITYDAYGIPFATHPTDLTTGNTSGVVGYGCPNGVLDVNDYDYFVALYGGSNFRADWNRDGTIDTSDLFAFLADYRPLFLRAWSTVATTYRENSTLASKHMKEPLINYTTS